MIPYLKSVKIIDGYSESLADIQILAKLVRKAKMHMKLANF